VADELLGARRERDEIRWPHQPGEHTLAIEREVRALSGMAIA
jgi:hypothetical protein